MAMSTGAKVAIGAAVVGGVGLTAWALWPKKAASATTPVKCPPGTLDSSGNGTGPCVPTSKGGGGGATNQPANQFTLGPGDNGSTLTASPGDTIIIGLPEDAATGSMWTPAVQTDGVLQLNTDTTTADSSGTTHVFTLQVMQLGTTQLQANLVDPSGNILKTWSVTVNVVARASAQPSQPVGGVAPDTVVSPFGTKVIGQQGAPLTKGAHI